MGDKHKILELIGQVERLTGEVEFFTEKCNRLTKALNDALECLDKSAVSIATVYHVRHGLRNALKEQSDER